MERVKPQALRTNNDNNNKNNSNSVNIKEGRTALEDRAVILIAPNEDFGDGANGLDEQVPVVIGHRRVLRQDVIHVPEETKRGGSV